MPYLMLSDWEYTAILQQVWLFHIHPTKQLLIILSLLITAGFAWSAGFPAFYVEVQDEAMYPTASAGFKLYAYGTYCIWLQYDIYRIARYAISKWYRYSLKQYLQDGQALYFSYKNLPEAFLKFSWFWLFLGKYCKRML